MDPVIEIDQVTKTYRARTGTRVLLGKGGLAEKISGKKHDTFHALENVSFTVDPGESLGIIGANGSGKSTLLKLIAGVTVPSQGTINVRGRVASLLELGAGFHPMLTGRENVYLNAGILGMRHKQVDAVFDEIVEFSGIGRFIDQPVDTYSSGMYVRIAFSVAAYTNPDIFLIDEVLSVGDEEFQRRCRRRIGELMDQGKTVVFVSHDLGIVNTLCERVILLSQGKMLLRETTSKAIDFYLRQIGEEKGLCTMVHGPMEAIVCNGRISIFYNEEEVTSASGLQFQVFYMGHWQNSQDADWSITDKTETSCTAEGILAKVGITLVWKITLENGKFHWDLALRNEQSVSINKYEINMFFPTRFNQWMYDDTNGMFQDILPDDTNYLAATSPELLFETASLLANDEGLCAAIGLETENQRPMCRASWHNTDFMTGCRALRIEESPMDGVIAFEPGTHTLINMALDPTLSREEVQNKLGIDSSRYTIESGPLRSRFDRGKIRLTHDGVQLTSMLHFYTSMLVNNVWYDSINFRWDQIEPIDRGFRVAGTSRRIPITQIWELTSTDNGLHIDIFLDIDEKIDIQEYHSSILLSPDYTQWKTDHESGSFPTIDTSSNDWSHVSTKYEPGQSAIATGPSLPTLTFSGKFQDEMLPHTILNTNFQQASRVLQALRLPTHSMFTLDTGRHLYMNVDIMTSYEND
ncbi:MAG: hypothetical protein COA73_14095 [Candidatus Hydrogenedentota bacterium]|nr:MAG: hypothetical protein COA73_14095 [Candidatus Hydrogenedentota bacterium]